MRRRSNEAIKQPIGTLYELMKQCGFRCFVNKKKDRKYPTPLAEDEKKAFKGGYYEFYPATFERNKARAMKGLLTICVGTPPRRQADGPCSL